MRRRTPRRRRFNRRVCGSDARTPIGGHRTGGDHPVRPFADDEEHVVLRNHGERPFLHGTLMRQLHQLTNGLELTTKLRIQPHRCTSPPRAIHRLRSTADTLLQLCLISRPEATKYRGLTVEVACLYWTPEEPAHASSDPAIERSSASCWRTACGPGRLTSSSCESAQPDPAATATSLRQASTARGAADKAARDHHRHRVRAQCCRIGDVESHRRSRRRQPRQVRPRDERVRVENEQQGDGRNAGDVR